ncbi:iron complex outermembrane receptor protein [Pseudoduganella flava]|uniref:Iron complex outermembrane receptor protein n=1 Tax=Pseudoduganella flava TaxID=871742 RepID=A0A562Q0D2_9BURK|nr:TonB-dependent receptor [Pseudoduganella flava]QGZ38350.1 TonB-dependent receptor [Pseudoduganella flava]TWI50108.1 iron complex outermembrane receptor protein [Pseudoduganella flava]
MHQRTKIAIAVAMALPSLALAQAQSEPLQRVEVTGSRIRQVDLETAQPVMKVTAEQIQATGLITVGDILNQMTAVAPPAFSKGATLTSNREMGGQFIDMRNLGAQRLLVLVDGKRWTQTVDGYTDISTVPSSMIERIEILKDGASAIYGSDAIAGVVNIILKKKLEGGQLSIYRGINKGGDARNDDVSLTYGAASDTASLMFGLTYSNQGTVWARDRAITSTSYGPEHDTAGLGVGQFGRIRNVTASGAAGSTIDKILNHTGTWQNPGVGADSRNPANYHNYGSGAPDDLFNSTSQMMFQAPVKLTSIFTKGTIDLPNNMKFSTTAMYADRLSTTQNAGYPVNSLTKANFPVYISKDSYYNPYGNSVAGAGNGQDLFFYRRTIEVPRVTENRNQTMHIDMTLSGEFNAIGRDFNWDVGYNRSQVRGTTHGTGNLNLLNLRNALGPSFKNNAGAVQCGTLASPIPLSQCVPFDIIGGPNAATPEALAYVFATGQGTYGSTVNSATANIAGELFQLPAGGVGFAGGLEHREVRGYDEPGQLEQSGYSTDLGAKTTRGRYTVREAYLEANIPVLKDVFLAKSLSLDLASRYSDYSNFGSTTNSKASFMWKPIDDLLARGTWAEGFRAPALGDTFGGGGASYDTYLDICDSRYGQAATNSAVAARCAAAGVPTGFRQVNATGAPVAGGGSQTPFPFDTGVGNNSLRPETAKSKTLGLVYSPSYVKGLTATIDWFKIQVENRIVDVTTKYTLEQCYLYGVSDFCNNVTRGATGQITNLRRGNLNLGSLETEGVDFGINYRLPRNAYGQFTVRSESTWVKSYKIKSTADTDWVEYNGEYLYNRLKSNLSLDWNLGNWNATYTMRYQSGVKDDCWDSAEGVECSNPDGEASFGAYNKLGSVTYSDVNVGYATPWKGKIQFGINNVWGKKPRIAYRTNSSGSAVDPDLPLDRFFYVRYNQSF